MSCLGSRCGVQRSRTRAKGRYILTLTLALALALALTLTQVMHKSVGVLGDCVSTYPYP